MWFPRGAWPTTSSRCLWREVMGVSAKAPEIHLQADTCISFLVFLCWLITYHSSCSHLVTSCCTILFLMFCLTVKHILRQHLGLTHVNLSFFPTLLSMKLRGLVACSGFCLDKEYVDSMASVFLIIPSTMTCSCLCRVLSCILSTCVIWVYGLSLQCTKVIIKAEVWDGKYNYYISCWEYQHHSPFGLFISS